MEESSNNKLICAKCRVPLEEGLVDFNYMGYAFSAEVPRCPQCGYVYISEELAAGKIRDVEASLEIK